MRSCRRPKCSIPSWRRKSDASWRRTATVMRMERWCVVPPALEVAGMIQLPIVAERASGPALIAEMLEDQQSLSAVDKFSEWHTNGVSERRAGERTSARHNSRYRSLL